MQVVPSGIPLSFEVTYDSPSLHVGMSVFDDTGVSPVLIGSIIPMSVIVDNTYRAKFTAQNGRNYLIVKGVYTDNSYTTLDPAYLQASDTIYAQNYTTGNESVVGGASDFPVLGFVEESDSLLGFVSENEILIGAIEENLVLGLIT